MKHSLCVILLFSGVSALYAMNDPMDEAVTQVNLSFSDTPDGQIGASVNRFVLEASGTLHDILEDIGVSEQAIPLPIIDQSTWTSIIEPALRVIARIPVQEQKIASLEKILNDQVYSKQISGIVLLYVATLNAADYLDIPLLVMTATEQCAQFLKDHWREFLGNPHQFTNMSRLNPSLQRIILEKMADSLRLISAINRKTYPGGHTQPVTSIALSPDENTLYSGSYDFTIKLWDIANRQNPQLISTLDWRQEGGHRGKVVQSLVISPDGNTLASGEDNTIILWNVTNRKHPRAIGRIDASLFNDFRQSITSLVLGPDGNILYHGFSNGTITFWDITNRQNPQLISTIDQSKGGHIDAVMSLIISYDGNTLISGSNDNTIKLWNVASRQNPQLITTIDQSKGGHIDRVLCLALAPDGNTLATGSSDQSIKLWDITDRQNPQLLRTIDQSQHELVNAVLSLSFTPNDNTLVSGSSYQATNLWNIANRQHPQLIGRLDKTSGVFRLVINRYGNILCSLSTDSVIKLWNVEISLNDFDLLQGLLIYGITQHYRATGTKFQAYKEQRYLFDIYETIPESMRNLS